MQFNCFETGSDPKEVVQDIIQITYAQGGHRLYWEIVNSFTPTPQIGRLTGTPMVPDPEGI